MGLDIYLYTAEQEEASRAYDRAWEDLYARKEKDEITQEEYEALSKELPSWTGSSNVPANVNPDHLCNRRYLRSSYNESGFNSWVPKATGNGDATFYGIFDPILRDREEEYNITLTEEDLPQLFHVYEKADEIATQIRKSDGMTTTSVRAATLGSQDHLWDTPPTAAMALEWYRESVAKMNDPENKGPKWSYQDAKGLFLIEPIEVLGVVVGQDILGMPAAHLIYKTSEDTVQHYEQTAVICGEFAQEAADLIKKDGLCHIHWSG